MAWLPTQEEVSGFLSSWNTRKVLTTIRKHRDSVTQQTFKCGLNRILLAACREGDVTVLKELLPLSLSCYPIDHLFNYKVQAAKKKSDFLHSLETYHPTPGYYVPPVIVDDRTFVPTKDLQGSLLHIAAEEGKMKVVELLLEHGAKVDSINCCGRTPLMVSAENVKIAKFFIESGCNVNHQDKFGQTFLMLLIWKPKSFNALFELLLKAGADPKIKDQYGKTMVHYACQLKYNGGVVPLLVDKNAFEVDCKENGMVYYAGMPLSIWHSFKHFQKKDIFSPAFVLFSQLCELVSLSSDFKKKLPLILDSINNLGVSYNHAVSEPMYGNRREITTLDELNKLHTSANDWSMEVNYQRLIISDRIFGHDSEESITFLWYIIRDDPNPSVDADLVYLWLDKLSSLLEKQYITYSCIEKFYYLAINLKLDLLSFVGKYNMVDIVSKFTKCVKLLLQDRPMNHRHRYHMSPFGDDGVVPIGLEFIKSIHPSVAPALANKMADFLQEAFRGKIELDPTLLHDMVTSCEIHPHENRVDRITVHQSNILYEILLRQDDHQYDDNTLKFCEYICSLSSVDLVNSATPDKRTLLHFAVKMKSLKLVHFLLAQGAHPDAVDSYGLCPAERCDNNSEFQLMLKPDRLFCIASRAIIKGNLPYQTFDLPDKVKSSIRFHDKGRFFDL